MQNFIEAVIVIPPAIVEHIATVYVSACETTYSIAAYEYLVDYKALDAYKDDLAKARIRLLNSK